MAANKKSGSGTPGGTHDQHVKAGQQSHKNDGTKQSGSGSGSRSSSGGMRGGSSEQHAEAGRQSHKNDKR